MYSAKVNGITKVTQKLATVSSGLVPAIVTSMTTEMIRLQGYIIRNKLSGQVLKNRTGNLRRAIQQDVTVEGWFVRGRVFVGREASKYGRVHEYGGTFNIPQHLRRTSATVAMAKSESRFSLTALKLSSLKSGGRFGSIDFSARVNRARGGFDGDFVVVKAHTATYPERSFMRSSSLELQATIKANIQAAVKKFVTTGVANGTP
jgi:uncharacterized protein involved in outer membrane biogenesis